MLLTKAVRFETKADIDEAGKFSARASVYGVRDTAGDIVVPGAFTKSIARLGGQVKLLLQHNPSDVIGLATLRDSDTALLVEGQLELELQVARDTHTRLRKGLLDSMSIGYQVVEDSFVKGDRILSEIDLWECSVVTFPANPFARVTDVKTLEAYAADLPIVQSLLPVFADQDVRAALANVKAGRVLSASNRSKVSNAVAVMQEATATLQEILDSSDPDPDTRKAYTALQASAQQLLTTMRSFGAAA